MRRESDRDLPVVTGTGTLRHWHHDATSRQVMGAARDELSGCTRCRVTGVGRSGGGVGIDVSDLDGAWLYDEGSKRIELV